jgi:hypothetical protein
MSTPAPRRDTGDLTGRGSPYSRGAITGIGTFRKRAEEKTAARDHGRDFDEMLRSADQLDHHAHLLRRLHDGEFGPHWRRESRQDAPGGGS